MSDISITQASEFHAYFTQQREEINDKLDSSPPSNELSSINQKISSIRLEVDQISSLLPIYDRVKYEKQLYELEQKISTLRKSSNGNDKSKSKFSFNKSKSSSTSTSTITNIPKSQAELISDFGKTTDANGSTNSSIPQTTSNTISSPSVSTSNIHTITSQSNKVIHPPKDVQGTYTLSISDLTNCIIDLRSQSSTSSNGDTSIPKLTALHVKSLNKCILISSIIGGSGLLDDIRDSVLVLGCQQFRIHSSTDTSILLHVNSLPVIEHSSKLKFGPYPDYLISSDNVITNNDNDNYKKVQDFDWPLPTPSPNWALLPAEQSQDIITRDILGRIEVLKENEDVGVLLDKILESCITKT